MNPRVPGPRIRRRCRPSVATRTPLVVAWDLKSDATDAIIEWSNPILYIVHSRHPGLKWDVKSDASGVIVAWRFAGRVTNSKGRPGGGGVKAGVWREGCEGRDVKGGGAGRGVIGGVNKGMDKGRGLGGECELEGVACPLGQVGRSSFVCEK